MTDLLTIAEAQIAEKQCKEIEKVKERLEADRETIATAIKLVNEHTLYKCVNERYSRKYVLATEEMLKQDYLKEPDKYCYDRGIKFLSRDSQKSYNTGVLKVNGEVYYDIHYALESYEKRVNEKAKSIDGLYSRIRELQDEMELLEKEFPSLKKAIIEWQEYEKMMCSKGEEENEY